MDRIIPAVIFLAAIGSGVMGGFFYGFSNVVMAALGRLTPQGGIAAMQSINVTVLNPIFFIAFFGTALLSVVLAVAALLRFGQPGTYVLLAGSVLYLGGIILVTIVFNVPMNEALAGVDPSSPAGAELWGTYLHRWTTWNHVRTITGILAGACFVLALKTPV
ncbi:hypothetical protein C5748_16690 [Phyllobacterium phragmitis]|uniref:DUF1772 domain-containing protein n=1 Tax=Phyllobacterium phragmitis TaxID=2670329 RepID=A0A2S9IPG3_9HYPH|nr:anthrone oxygenase family protein [Phyllobacterium phragmitis]PRD42417.1 hypothetical protein C5748_16690 [Phyllobacterium phragmitis]